MTMTKKLMAAAAAFALTASPVMAAGNADAPAREATSVAQSEELFGEDGGGWLLFVLLGAAAIVGMILILDDPASP